MARVMKGRSLRSPSNLYRIDEEEGEPQVEVKPIRSSYQRIRSWQPNRRWTPPAPKKIARCESDDINERAEEFIRNFRQQLQLQRHHSMGDLEKMLCNMQADK